MDLGVALRGDPVSPHPGSSVLRHRGVVRLGGLRSLRRDSSVLRVRGGVLAVGGLPSPRPDLSVPKDLGVAFPAGDRRRPRQGVSVVVGLALRMGAGRVAARCRPRNRRVLAADPQAGRRLRPELLGCRATGLAAPVCRCLQAPRAGVAELRCSPVPCPVDHHEAMACHPVGLRVATLRRVGHLMLTAGRVSCCPAGRSGPEARQCRPAPRLACRVVVARLTVRVSSVRPGVPGCHPVRTPGSGPFATSARRGPAGCPRLPCPRRVVVVVPRGAGSRRRRISRRACRSPATRRPCRPRPAVSPVGAVDAVTRVPTGRRARRPVGVTRSPAPDRCDRAQMAAVGGVRPTQRAWTRPRPADRLLNGRSEPSRVAHPSQAHPAAGRPAAASAARRRRASAGGTTPVAGTCPVPCRLGGALCRRADRRPRAACRR
ncbi:hypothetical protein SAMN05421684_4812 [Asanoa ishikariensis]|uniref:Uncharacterized protein n=1 Tax=Asanoa ishikariensis TaxID=137265 RepID=A0A1H3SBT5_9ACTN|nr:hypothetical protein SAMN05421684_4812 [Asanoa ishikariensis]